jgi:cytochrome c peroxidase
MAMHASKSLLLLSAAVFTFMACGGGPHPEAEEEEEGDPAEVVLGERLFLETRFAQSYFAANGTAVNAPGPNDPVVESTVTTGDPLPGPFQGEAINCRACHLVDEQLGAPGGGVRTYADFARHSPIPARDDGETVTPRNSPALVNATLARNDPFFLHFDGEFATIADLVVGTLTGRNFGWLVPEQNAAITHVAAVIRGDDGQGTLANDFGNLPYRVVITGTDPAIPAELRLPPPLRLDVDNASDSEVVAGVSQIIGAYVDSLRFSEDDDGPNASPYDTFLRKNGLPRAPDRGETPAVYSARLRDLINALEEPRFVAEENGSFRLHDQEFVFDELELQGLKIFLANDPASASHGVGNCVSCHPAPSFTDFRFHNNGASQDEYDAIHGVGAFAQLAIPTLAERDADPAAFLPPSPSYPNATGRFRSVPSAAAPERTDLGVWNVVGNPAMPAPQETLTSLLCDQLRPSDDCTATTLLPLSVALFKTPGLRDLSQSPPFFHTGASDTPEDVVDFYVRIAPRARQGELRNGAPELADTRLTPDDGAPLAAFLRALNEDYD